MPSLFDINVAVSALRAHQYALSVTGHNIANANTEGFRRQAPVFQAGNPLTGTFAMTGIGIPQLGTGVAVRTVQRMQSSYLDGQVRMMNHQLGSWTTRNDALRQIEAAFGEPTGNGLRAVLDQFWNSWDDLASNPKSLPARIAVVQGASTLSDHIRGLYGDLRGLQAETDHMVVAKANEINQMTREIADLNQQITQSQAGGFQPNDLLDRRDLLVEQLSRIARVEVYGSGGIDMMISIGGKSVVQGDYASQIEITEGDNGWSKLTWSDDGSDAVIPGGELEGLMNMRDVVLEDYITSLNTIAQTLVTEVNTIHVNGIDLNGNVAGDFFIAGTDAADMAVDPAVLASPALVAAQIGTSDINSIALEISALRSKALIGTQTIGGAYTSLIATIGTDVREAATRSEVLEASAKQIMTQRESISGVSIDEEMANMVRFQQGYNAAARVFTVVDEMIDQLISRTGASGR